MTNLTVAFAILRTRLTMRVSASPWHTVGDHKVYFFQKYSRNLATFLTNSTAQSPSSEVDTFGKSGNFPHFT
jgi:hypothetical protein